MEQDDLFSWMTRGLAGFSSEAPATPNPDQRFNRFDAAEFVGHRSMHGGDQWLYNFENGYGASIVCHAYSYGGPQGLFELAVIHGPDDDLCYATPITNDVVGRQTDPEIFRLLQEIRELPPNNTCSHG